MLEQEILQFNIPELRKDVSKIENLFWLSRNLLIQNKDNPAVHKVLKKVNKRIKGKLQRW